jgi:hypothetical protein
VRRGVASSAPRLLLFLLFFFFMDGTGKETLSQGKGCGGGNEGGVAAVDGCSGDDYGGDAETSGGGG